MSSLQGKRVLIFLQRGWGLKIGSFLAKKMFDEGCKMGAIASTIYSEVKNQKEVDYEYVVNHDEILSEPKKYLAGEEITIKEICDDLGIESIWPIMWSVRMYTRSYKERFFYSFNKNVEEEVMLDYAKAIYKCVKQTFKEFKPDIIFAPNFVSLYQIMFSLYARRHGSKMCVLTESKVRGYYFMVESYKEDVGRVFDRIRELNQGQTVSPNLPTAKQYIEEFRAKKKPPIYFSEAMKPTKTSIFYLLRLAFRFVFKSLKWYIKRPANPWKSVGISTQWRSPRFVLRDYLATKKYKKFMDDFSYYPLEKVKKFVFYPLQTQPEITVDVVAPYFSNQIEIARLLAMALPEEYTLLVKDHPVMRGYQTPAYIKKLARTINVKLVDYRVPSEELIKKSDLIISSGGSILAEAAYHCKPAIQLGDLGTTLSLPNVTKHTDLTTISGKIKELLKVNLQNDEYQRAIENYVTAILDVGYEINVPALWSGKDQSQLENLWNIYKKEIIGW